MKKAKYVILEHLRELCEGQESVTTVEVAQSAHLSRNVVTTYLSKLLDEDLVEKSGQRPVYWRPKRKNQAFEGFIGVNGSLETTINECKMAVTYPPKGFPVLITGESGVGKSYLASLIHQYGVEEKIIEPQAKFVTLNCADYANNPELLSSVLFGYRKGAFTGATEDSEGLIKQADGGFLFLDEVHRLNSESQEKLFTLLDLGTYYPLGEKEQAISVDIRFIFATTEAIDKTLLRTFQRRVPLTIHLPAFHQRPLCERLAVIFADFISEANKLDKQFCVGIKDVFCLASGRYKGNLGDVKNQIRLLCARAFMEQPNQSIIDIGEKEYGTVNISNDTSFYYLTARMMANQREQLMNQVSQTGQIENIIEMRFLIHTEIRKIRKYFGEVFVEGLLIDSLMKLIQQQLTSYQQTYGVFQEVEKRDIQEAAIVLYLFLESDQSQESPQNIVEQVKRLYPRSYYLMGKFVESLHSSAHLGLDEQALLSCFFIFILFGTEAEKIETIQTLCLLFSHGEMASSIQRVVNSLCGNYVFEAFDMPIDASMKAISHEVEVFLKQQNNREQEIILLFDMGSLSQMYKEVKKQSDADLMVINNLTTSMALDIGLQVQNGTAFKGIAQKAENYAKLTSVQYYEGLSQNKHIIVSCMSGVGLSEAIKEIMGTCLCAETEIITMDYKDLRQALAVEDFEYLANTQMILTTTDIESINEVPIINIYDVMEQTGAEELKQLLRQGGESELSCNLLLEKLLEFFTIEGIGARLQFLNPEVAMKEVQKIIEKYELYYELALTGRDKLNLCMHLALLIERMIVSSRDSLSLEEDNLAVEGDKQDFYSVSKNIFHEIEGKYNIVVDNYELSLMYELLRTKF